tara:strand:- start:320 stop:457 length:138 start_codon:yes stop_codon:yes gene_type:complete
MSNLTEKIVLKEEIVLKIINLEEIVKKEKELKNKEVDLFVLLPEY